MQAVLRYSQVVAGEGYLCLRVADHVIDAPEQSEESGDESLFRSADAVGNHDVRGAAAEFEQEGQGVPRVFGGGEIEAAAPAKGVPGQRRAAPAEALKQAGHPSSAVRHVRKGEDARVQGVRQFPEILARVFGLVDQTGFDGGDIGGHDEKPSVSGCVVFAHPRILS